MRRLRAAMRRLMNGFFAGRRDRDLADELESHLQLHIDDLRSGQSPDEARRHAVLALGGLDQTKERYRDLRGFPFFSQFAQDLRYAARAWRRNPGFSATAILTLALGIGANTALFSMLDALVVRSLPVSRPDGLVQLLDDGRDTWTYPRFQTLRSAKLLVGVTATRELSTPVQIEEDGTVRPALLHAVSGEYFDLLGVEAREGRVFNRAAASTSSPAVAVISDEYWHRRYRADPAAIGQRIRYPYSAREFTIIGITPPSFRGTLVDAPTDIWIPLEQHEPPGSQLYSIGRWLRVMGRLPPGVTPTQAAAEVSAIVGRKVQVEGGRNGFSTLRGQYLRPLAILQIVVGLVLLVACANLANLLLARAAAREREFAIRRAIGASKGRLVRQLVTESLLISALGGAFALVVAYFLSAAILGFLPPKSVAALANLSFHPSGRVLSFGVAISLLTCLAFSLVPALRATRGRGGDTLKVGAPAGGVSSRLTSRALVVCEVALCTFLVIGAGLFAKTLEKLWAQDLGFAAAQVIVADIDVPRELRSHQDQVFEDLRARAARLPGVRVAAYTRIGQLSGGSVDYAYFLQHGPAQVEALDQRVSPGFFEAMGTELRAGRDFDDRDRASTPHVAVVNDAFVRQYFGGAPPLGQRFGTTAEARGEIEIVGVVHDSKWISLREPPQPMVYRPVQQTSTPDATLVVRATGNLGVLAKALSSAAQTIDSRLTLEDVAPFTDIVNRTLTTERLVAQLSTGFAFLALSIACVGVYGVLAYGVVRRTREIGVRMALGATRLDVRWMILRESLAMLGVGFPLGVAIALAGVRAVSSMLYGVTFYDPAIIATALVVLAAVLLAAAYLPARRATMIDPLTALRTE